MGRRPEAIFFEKYSIRTKLKEKVKRLPRTKPRITQIYKMPAPKIIEPKKPPPDRDRLKWGTSGSKTMSLKGVLDIGYRRYSNTGINIGSGPNIGPIYIRTNEKLIVRPARKTSCTLAAY